MANRFWVGGTAAWDGTAGTKWALTTGGAGGQAIPTSADDVFFDAASGAVTVTLSSGNTGAKSITCTGFTGTLAGSGNITVSGSVLLVAGMTFSWTGTLTLAGTGTLTCAGKSINNMTINGSGITVTPADAISMTLTLTLTQGTLDLSANNPDVTIGGNFGSSGASAKTLNMGSGTWTMTSTTANFNISAASFTLNVGTATVKYTDTSNGTKSVSVANFKTLPKIWCAGAGKGAFAIAGGTCTLSDIIFDSGWMEWTMQQSFTYTVGGTITFNGSITKMLTIRSDVLGSRATLSKAAGVVPLSWVAIRDMAFSGGAIFVATNSADIADNTGITVTPPPSLLAAYQPGII